MVCLFPITVRRGDPNEAVVPCGKCYNCLANMRNDYIFRLKAEYLSSFGGLFLTLTYNDENLPYKEVIINGEHIKKPFPDKRNIQLFLKRLRKSLGFSCLRYFCCSEYGDITLRPHWHMLLFFTQSITFDAKLYDLITEKWALGNVQFGDITDASITYVTKYMLKDSKYLFDINDTCRLMSRNPAIGSNIIMNQLELHNLKNRDLSFVSVYGNKSRIPRIFLDKLKNHFTENELLSLKSKRISNFENKLLSSARAKGMSLEEYKLSLIDQYNARESVVKKHLVKHDKL